MNVQNKEKGFTIIEVVLVLAIAGLIFLMVFIALPALQRSQRDTARRNDVSTVSSAVSTYVSNNRGSFPTQAQIRGYVTGLSDNSVVDQITVGTAADTGAYTPADTVIHIRQGVKCGASTGTQALTTAGATRRSFVVITRLEAGGDDGTAFCQDS